MKDLLIRIIFRLRNRLKVRIKKPVKHTTECLTSYSTSYMEYFRFSTLYKKEPGTVEWLHDTIKPGSVLLDIGANVGIYTCLAAKLGDRNTHVYAIEPNAFSFARLMENTISNDCQERVTLMNIALADSDSLLSFHYNNTIAAASGSQAGEPVSEYGVCFKPVSSELKLCRSIDSLYRQGAFKKSPTHVKIDVDGLELSILMGMKEFLTRPDCPAYIQVEINPGLAEEIDDLLSSFGYRLAKRTGTITSQQSDLPLHDVAHNALYTKLK